jgi:hypothetical protein
VLRDVEWRRLVGRRFIVESTSSSLGVSPYETATFRVPGSFFAIATRVVERDAGGIAARKWLTLP